MSDTCAINPPAKDETPKAVETQTFEPGPGKHILFFGDPMCSWCWGFAPELQKIAKLVEGRAQFEMVMGGLRPGTKEPWDGEMRKYIRHHWQEVADKSGQPFDFARFDDEHFVYDTEPGCRAVVCVRTIDATKTLAMYEALQRGFYAQNLNITDPEILADLAQGVGIDRAQFVSHYADPKVRQRVSFDFKRSQAFGVQGFPSVLCADDGQYGFLTMGYRSFDSLHSDLEDWLKG
ncbi:MAG: DsbA family protein [Magnetovibrio sp.]|nr:DsbA family protein [Magnetovibrio sp.]